MNESQVIPQNWWLTDIQLHPGERKAITWHQKIQKSKLEVYHFEESENLETNLPLGTGTKEGI